MVISGSSKQETPLKKQLVALAKKALGKMDGKQVLVLLITCAVLLAGVYSFGLYLDSEKEQKILETSNQEKLAILKAIQFSSEQNAISRDFLMQVIADILVKAASETDGGIEIKGQNLSEKEALPK